MLSVPAQVRAAVDSRLICTARPCRSTTRCRIRTSSASSTRMARVSTARHRTRSSRAPVSSTSRRTTSGSGTRPVPRHRYFHAATEASSAVDLLAASRRVLAGLRVQQNDTALHVRLLAGRPFGARPAPRAAAVRRRGDRHGYSRRRVRRRAVVRWRLLPTRRRSPCRSTSRTSCSPTTTSTTSIGRTSDVFRQPYASTVSGLFDMQHFFDDVLAGLPPTTRAAAEAVVLLCQRSRANPQNPLRVRLRQNAVDRWSPHGAAARLSQPRRRGGSLRGTRSYPVDRLRSRGADVTVRTLTGFDHVNSWVQAMPRAGRWFRSLD